VLSCSSAVLFDRCLGSLQDVVDRGFVDGVALLTGAELSASFSNMSNLFCQW
jgi:hypothetical protein